MLQHKVSDKISVELLMPYMANELFKLVDEIGFF